MDPPRPPAPFLYKPGHDMARHYYFFLIKLNSCCDSLICWDNPFCVCWRGRAKTGKPNSLDDELRVSHEKASAAAMLTLQVRGHWYPGAVVEEIKTMKGFTQSHIKESEWSYTGLIIKSVIYPSFSSSSSFFSFSFFWVKLLTESIQHRLAVNSLCSPGWPQPQSSCLSFPSTKISDLCCSARLKSQQNSLE